MLTIKNTDTQEVNWYALPKYSVDLTKAFAKGTLPSGGQTTYDPPGTVNILFAFPPGREVAALCIAGDADLTVIFYNEGPGTWCDFAS